MIASKNKMGINLAKYIQDMYVENNNTDKNQRRYIND